MKAFSLIGECAEKSELVRRLVVELTGRGLRVSTIKRVSDAVDLERSGSATWKHRAAGAVEVMVASASRFALMREMPKGLMNSTCLACWQGWRRSTTFCLMGFGEAVIRSWKSSRLDRLGRKSRRMTPWCLP
jgi:hypothetical protein